MSEDSKNEAAQPQDNRRVPWAHAHYRDGHAYPCQQERDAQ